MQKDFDTWNVQKKALDQKQRELFFKEREIWWCAMGLNIGEEVYGKGANYLRPVIIFKKLTRNSCIVMPITSKPQNGTWYHPIQIHNKDRWIMMHQVRIISTNRLYERQAILLNVHFQELKKSVTKLFGLFQ